jgi:hypothetical protein
MGMEWNEWETDLVKRAEPFCQLDAASLCPSRRASPSPSPSPAEVDIGGLAFAGWGLVCWVGSINYNVNM